MSRATSLAKRVTNLLKLYAPPAFTVSKRIVTSTGGDSLIGRPGSVTYTDTVLSPQPTYARGMRRQVGGTDADDIATTAGTRIAQSYEMVVSVDALSEAELENSSLIFVFTDALGNTDLYRLEDYETMGLQGTPVAWLLYITSQSR